MGKKQKRVGVKISDNMSRILIIDYKLGNHQSVANALTYLGYKFLISNKKADILRADAFILPGVGAFGEAVDNLNNLKIIEVLSREVVKNKKPILGICLGMQIMMEDSQENGYHRGLGWVKGHVVRIAPKKHLRVPHVGWNNISITQKKPLFSLVQNNANYYFDHSYYVSCKPSVAAAQVLYGTEIAAAITTSNICGVQFHPEKSQNNGLRIYRSFFNYCDIN